MSRWMLVRHGETDWNRDGIIQGHKDIDLNQRGREQARRLGARLKGVEISHAYSSDLVRCRETYRGLMDGRDVVYAMSREIREQCYGLWEGSTYPQIEARDPGVYEEMMREFESFVPPEGESFAQLGRRVATFVQGLREAHTADDTVLVVGHGGSLRAMISVLLDIPLASTWRFSVDSCSLSVIDVRADWAVLELLNDTSHLGEEL